jgi:hypothetical protein
MGMINPIRVEHNPPKRSKCEFAKKMTFKPNFMVVVILNRSVFINVNLLSTDIFPYQLFLFQSYQAVAMDANIKEEPRDVTVTNH